MSNFLEILGIRKAMMMLVVVPLLCLTAVAVSMAVSSWRTSSEMNAIRDLAHLAPTISQLIHELQKERGASAGFISSNAAPDLAQRVKAQRAETDKWRRSYAEAIDAFNVDGFGPEFKELAAQSVQTLAALPEERGKVDNLSFKAPDMARAYTAKIHTFLAMIEVMAKLSSDDKVAKSIGVYTAILQAKENAGLERAMGAVGFSAGEFKPDVLQRMLLLTGGQESYFNAFKAHATKDEIAYFDAKLSGPVVVEVERMRAIAINSPYGETLDGVTGGQWFDASTARIDRLKEVEERIGENLLGLVDELDARAETRMFVEIALVLLVIIIQTAIGLRVVSHIASPITKIIDAIAAYRPGDALIMPAAERKDGFGDLARTLNVVGKFGLEAARIKAALDACQTSVMVADEDLKIIYLNSNLQDLFRKSEAAIRQDLPNFVSGGLIGSSLEKLRADGGPTGGEISALTTTLNAPVTLGGLRIALSVSPVFNMAGDRIATVVEWRDQTAELTALEEVDAVVNAALDGDLSRRLPLEGKEGFMRGLAGSVNRLTEVVDDVTGAVSGMIQGLAQGDLNRKIVGDYKGSFGELQRNANGALDSLSGIVTEIRATCDEVNGAASEIAGATDDLAQRTEQAATNLEQTAASTRTMAETVHQNAESANNANLLAIEANTCAKTGGDVVGKAVNAMSQIDKSAGKIAEIIGVIDEISFQTNLLALNASVEAARAGEAGKGFAVVAQEVRALAQRSSQAANDIKTLIQDSNGQVKQGVELVNRAGEGLTEILNSIGQVATIVEDIAKASREQSTGIQEINRSVSAMDEMTQQNAAMVEESSAAAQALSGQARTLNDLLAFFGADKQTHTDRAHAA